MGSRDGKTETSGKSKAVAIKKETKCKLAIGTKENIVALGTVIMVDGPIHGMSLGANNLRIYVEVPIKGDADLPFSNILGKIFTVKQSVRTHVVWPRDLVMMQNKEDSLVLAMINPLTQVVHYFDSLGVPHVDHGMKSLG